MLKVAVVYVIFRQFYAGTFVISFAIWAPSFKLQRQKFYVCRSKSNECDTVLRFEIIIHRLITLIDGIVKSHK